MRQSDLPEVIGSLDGSAGVRAQGQLQSLHASPWSGLNLRDFLARPCTPCRGPQSCSRCADEHGRGGSDSWVVNVEQSAGCLGAGSL